MDGLKYAAQVEKWDLFEIEIQGKAEGNPFTDYEIQGVFTGKNETVTVDGFYDGDGIYRVRFMPSFEGEYRFKVTGSFSKEEYEGGFTVTAPSKGNHGPVRVANTYHFAYEDGTPYYSIGTTCYVWNLQSDELIEQTFETLKNSAFNKIRFCVFPKHYDYNLGEPRSYPYEGTPMDSSVLTKENFFGYTGKTEGNHWDFTRFNPKHFQHIEKCILRLRDMGIEADLIVMHPYDRWGFAQMTKEQDALYWKYVLARFSAYRNMWWSLANEYDLFDHKAVEDWEGYAKIICEQDPYHHLRSIHNCLVFYDYNRPWITHCSIQRQDLYKSSELVNEWREKYQNSETLTEVRSQTIGIIGFGTIGRLVVERLKGFHPTILVNDPFADEDKIREEGCEPVTKEELLKRSDVVTIHARINAGDPPIIGKEEFGQMKETAYLINTARAVAVDMKELYHALSEHKIMGAAIDVFPTEPVTKDEPLLKLDNITVTNHQGGATVESYVKAPEMVLDMLKQTLE